MDQGERDRQNILAAITKAVIEEIGTPGITLGPDTTSNDVPGWDSVAHARILAALEQMLDIKLDMDRGFALGNVGQLIDLIQETRAAP